MDKLGLLILGQTPRPDLGAVFSPCLGNVSILQGGALDGVPTSEIDALAAQGGEYPLFVILADGTTREISLYNLLPLLGKKAHNLADQGASVLVLICAGNFPDIDSPLPMIYPGRVLPALLGAVSSTKEIGIVLPNERQMDSAKKHWTEKGFQVRTQFASPKEPAALDEAVAALVPDDPEMIVLDCMGFSPQEAKRVRPLAQRPVICPQSLLPRVAAELLGV